MAVETESPPIPQAESDERVAREREAVEEDREVDDRQLEQENAQLEKEIEQEIRGTNSTCDSFANLFTKSIRNHGGRTKQSFQCPRIFGFFGTVHEDCTTCTER